MRACPPTGPLTISVVVPAHNEENTVGRCLDALFRGAEGQLEVVVVCNGCTDRTAAVASTFAPQAKVIETPIASKSHALNLGDEAVVAFPRFYVDADVEVSGASLLEAAKPLEEGRAMAAAPALRLDVEDAPWPVRAYYRIWRQLPYVRESLIGSGVYGLSREGRARFRYFPDVIADDRYVKDLFDPGERLSVDGCEFLVRVPRTTRDLINRKIRVFTGNLQLGANADSSASNLPGWLHAVALRPRLLSSLPAYAIISLLARRRARRRVQDGDFRTWERDDSSRVEKAT